MFCRHEGREEKGQGGRVSLYRLAHCERAVEAGTPIAGVQNCGKEYSEVN